MAKMGYETLERLSREMTSLAKSNIPLPDGLRELARTFQRQNQRDLYEGLARSLSRGSSLSDALAVHRAPQEYVAALRCAEMSGNLSSVLEFSVDHCRRVKRHFAAVATQLVYPCLIIAAAVGILLLLSHTAIPELAKAFVRLEVPLPIITRAVVRTASLLRTPAGTALAAILILGIAGSALSSPFTRLAPRVLAKIPIFTPLLAVGDMAVVMRFLSVMLGRGVPLPVALRGIAPTVWVRAIREALMRMAHRADQGHPVGDGLVDVASPLTAHLFCQAEARGDLADSCQGIAEYCEDRYEKWSGQILAALEPILIVALGLIVGTIVVSLYTPLLDLPKHIR